MCQLRSERSCRSWAERWRKVLAVGNPQAGERDAPRFLIERGAARVLSTRVRDPYRSPRQSVARPHAAALPNRSDAMIPGLHSVSLRSDDRRFRVLLGGPRAAALYCGDAPGARPPPPATSFRAEAAASARDHAAAAVRARPPAIPLHSTTQPGPEQLTVQGPEPEQPTVHGPSHLTLQRPEPEHPTTAPGPTSSVQLPEPEQPA
jgi:hypothetical protein